MQTPWIKRLVQGKKEADLGQTLHQLLNLKDPLRLHRFAEYSLDRGLDPDSTELSPGCLVSEKAIKFVGSNTGFSNLHMAS